MSKLAPRWTFVLTFTLCAVLFALPASAQPRPAPKRRPPVAHLSPQQQRAMLVAQMIKWLSTEEAEIEIGRRAYPLVLAQMGGAWKNPKAEQRVVRIANSIVQKNCKRRNIRYTVTLVNSPEINAGSLMGGYIFLTRGLLATHNDEELAGVIAHEVAHIEAAHGRKQMIQALVSTRIIERHADRRDSLIAEAAKVSRQRMLAGYSRDQEREADQLAVLYLIRSGHNPLGLISSIWKIGGGPVSAPLPGQAKPRAPQGKPPWPQLAGGIPMPRVCSRSRKPAPGFTGYVYVPVGRQRMFGDSPRAVMRLFDDHPPLEERLASVCELTRAAKIFVPEEGPYFPDDDPDPREVDPDLFRQPATARVRLHASGIKLCFPWGELSVGEAAAEPRPVWHLPAAQFSAAGLKPMFARFNFRGLRGTPAYPAPGYGDIDKVLRKQARLRETMPASLRPNLGRGTSKGRWEGRRQPPRPR